jgi:curved DNA-binding protein CbpA
MSAWTPTPGPGDAEGLYAVLGLSPHSTVTEVRQAHRREAAVWHPDRCTDPSAEARIRWINKCTRRAG